METKFTVSIDVPRQGDGKTGVKVTGRPENVEKAKALFAPTRINYEAIEPIAELFSDLDVSIDSRADDYEKAEADPAFPGFHRLEYGLWEKNSTEGLDPNDYRKKEDGSYQKIEKNDKVETPTAS